MPIYEYLCTEQGHRFEMHQKMADEPVSSCPTCGGKAKKLISATAFQLKGGGWYKDGYASSSSAGSSSSTSSTTSASATPDVTSTKTETTKKE